jgi:DNA-binding Lrp family transcriptional regulator
VALYFPSAELIVGLYPYTTRLFRVNGHINKLKADTVNSWKTIKSYLLNPGKTKTVALIGINHTAIGHYLGNVLGGVQDLINNGNVDKVDQFIVIPPCYFGNLNEIFPEIAPEKIRVVKKGEEISLMEEITKDNGFIFKSDAALYVEEELANRIYSISLAKCSSAFLAEVEKAKQESFPLIFVTVRLGRRRWIDQLEGIANIIKSLSEDFPTLGVVFDGISKTSEEDISEFDIDLIEKQKELVSKIASLLPQQVKVYGTIGRFMYESIVWAKAIDFYLAPVGSGLSKVQWIANKPGVTHENSLSPLTMQEMRRRSLLNPNPSDHFPDWPVALLTNLQQENGVMPKYVPRNHITDFPDEIHDWVSVNYDFDWRVAYEECLKLAKSLKRD